MYDANATDNGGSVDAGIVYSLAGTGVDNNKFNISSVGLVTFKTSTSYASPQDVGANNVYDINIRATDAVGNYSDKAVAISVTNGSFDIYSSATVRNTSTNLGKLLFGVTVDAGSTFYYWDRSGDGTTGGAQGPLSNLANDYLDHNTLDGLFNNDINNVKNTTVVNADGL